MKHNFKTTIMAVIAAIMFGSCSTPRDIAYFHDMSDGSTEQIHAPGRITISPEDKISILVNSRDEQLTGLFNLPYVSRQLGATGSSGTVQGVSGYTVDPYGDIDFPVLGKLHVAGKTRDQLASYVKEELVSRDLVKDPVVTVEFMNLSVIVAGEVNKPGRYDVTKDRLTILDAISMAGDLTIYGKRDNVKVQRVEGNQVRTYRVDLSSGRELYSSPAYYLQQNDVVYIEPNDTRARQSTVNGNNVRSTSFWLSLASFMTSVAVLIFR